MRLTVKRLFLIDGIGALVSAVALGILMPTFNSYFEVPIDTLYILASAPIVFAAYDIVCFTQSASSKALRIIAFGNIGYCVLSVLLILKDFDQITSLAVIYFVLEVVIVLSLAFVELKKSSS